MMKRRRISEVYTPLHSAVKKRRDRSVAVQNANLDDSLFDSKSAQQQQQKQQQRRKSGLEKETQRDDSVEEDVPPPPKELYNTTWNLWTVSPLYKFSQTDSKLVEYGKLLTAHLEAEQSLGKGVAVGTLPSEGQRSFGKARFEVLSDIAYLERDPDAIAITVTKPGAKEGSAPMLRAILCCVGGGEPTDGFTHLPLLLMKGSASISQKLIGWLEEMFDCRTSKLEFRPYELIWIATEWAAAEDEIGTKSDRPLELTYSTPSSIVGLDKITFEIDPNAVRELRTSILHTEGTDALIGTELMEALETHFYNHLKIKLGMLTLSRVGTYTSFVGQEGRLKLLPVPSPNHQSTILVLQYLTFVACKQKLLTTMA